MTPIHADKTRFPCSRCGKPTRCNDLNRGDTGRVQICDPCNDAETIQQLDKTNDYFTDNDFRGERASPAPDTLEDIEFSW